MIFADFVVRERKQERERERERESNTLYNTTLSRSVQFRGK
jgi:hypothetical protein|tara:strand:+ start:3078 stop:3200 length:123 start_codon:yes stop_codon:yes gene_type:complete